MVARVREHSHLVCVFFSKSPKCFISLHFERWCTARCCNVLERWTNEPNTNVWQLPWICPSIKKWHRNNCGHKTKIHYTWKWLGKLVTYLAWIELMWGVVLPLVCFLPCWWSVFRHNLSSFSAAVKGSYVLFVCTYIRFASTQRRIKRLQYNCKACLYRSFIYKYNKSGCRTDADKTDWMKFSQTGGEFQRKKTKQMCTNMFFKSLLYCHHICQRYL